MLSLSKPLKQAAKQEGDAYCLRGIPCKAWLEGLRCSQCSRSRKGKNTRRPATPMHLASIISPLEATSYTLATHSSSSHSLYCLDIYCNSFSIGTFSSAAGSIFLCPLTSPKPIARRSVSTNPSPDSPHLSPTVYMLSHGCRFHCVAAQWITRNALAIGDRPQESAVKYTPLLRSPK